MQSTSRPHFDCEKIARHDLLPMPIEKLFPSCLSVAFSGRPGVRNALPSYFLAINFRCHASNVSGVTIVAAPKLCDPTSRLSLARRHRWSSAKRSRCRPICARRTRFSSTRYSITRCCLRFNQPAKETTRNENGSRHVRIDAAYHAPNRGSVGQKTRIKFLDTTRSRIYSSI